MKRIILIIILIFISTISINSFGIAAEINPDIKKEIIDRCTENMEAYGNVMIKSCVDQDLESFVKIQQYNDSYPKILERCTKQLKNYGYMMILSCIEEDIKAKKELENY